jgi:hypothetical protein
VGNELQKIVLGENLMKDRPKHDHANILACLGKEKRAKKLACWDQNLQIQIKEIQNFVDG